jgi:hypothetical protein
MEFGSSESADAAPPGCPPWFEAPGRREEQRAHPLRSGTGPFLFRGKNADLCLDEQWDSKTDWLRVAAARALHGWERSQGFELISTPCPQADF